jgi:hypothetical protein
LTDTTGPDTAGPADRDPLTTTERHAIRLAVDALKAARSHDWDTATRAMQRIGDECGPEGVELAVRTMAEAVTARFGHAPGRPVTIRLATSGNGLLGQPAGETTSPELIWAGRMLAARAADDADTWDALITALPNDPRVMGRHVGQFLQMCAHTLNLLDAARRPAHTLN